ncbi:SDR family oxidoreductase [Sphingomonas montanisoli]|uniref:SDR family oxidoreductase n=2 Tax=Sphingomonas montanisoli TaxID=2606412 RepID=A0A5D9C965_9SPHN|nr:SDR family oxidoreductase [Sphingomonas montanisoli]
MAENETRYATAASIGRDNSICYIDRSCDYFAYRPVRPAARGGWMSAKALAGQVALITGGSGSIGSATAKALAADGAAILLMARDAGNLDATIAELRGQGATVDGFVGDAGNEADVKAAVAAAVALGGRLDIVVATVGGGGGWRPFMSYEAEEFRAIVERNVMTTFLAIRHGAARMEHGGSIICLSATSTQQVVPYLAAAATAKSGVEALMRAAAEELSPANIRVNAVRPGLIPGGNTGRLMAPDMLERGKAQIPLAKPTGRVGKPEDVAAAIRFLAGPESSWITGQSFAIDGGQELRKAADYEPIVREQHDEEAFRIFGHRGAI